jgi:hypothetical protein
MSVLDISCYENQKTWFLIFYLANDRACHWQGRFFHEPQAGCFWVHLRNLLFNPEVKSPEDFPGAFFFHR